MKRRIIVLALFSFLAISFTVKSQTNTKAVKPVFDTKHYNFKVIFNNVEMYFQEVEGTLPEKTAIVNGAGSSVTTPRKLPGITKGTMITFKKGICNSDGKNIDLTIKAIKNPVEIYLLDEYGKPNKHWTLTNAILGKSVPNTMKTPFFELESLVISGSFASDF
jgi:hypothetical protein